MIIVYFLLFILFISILITIHELGHFTAAKIFKVYCEEFSIGFGPKLFSIKRKNGETKFSLRAIPFGGYVSMYQEGAEIQDGISVDKSRSLDGIKAWKKLIILFAGVFMNAILALIFFFVSSFIPRQMLYYGNMSILEGSIAANAGLQTGQIIALDKYLIDDTTQYVDNYHLIDKSGVVTFTDDTTIDVFTYMNLDTLKDYSNIDLASYICMFETKIEEGKKVVNFSKEVKVDDKFKTLSLNIHTVEFVDETMEEYTLVNHTMEVNKDSQENKLASFGYSFYLDVIKSSSFKDAVINSFNQFGNSSTIIVRSFISLFTDKNAWNNMGGLIAIGVESSSILKNFGWSYFLTLWGTISVNLAIINLFPFPGLDGWQILVTTIESISRKKVPNKVKGIVSFVGLAILFIFMAIILIKDIFTYIL